jgi:hypothetical protein
MRDSRLRGSPETNETPMPQSVLILGFNLFPPLSAIVFGWSAFTLVLLYWIENLILGVVNVAKLIVIGVPSGKRGLVMTFTLVLFFILHYGLFCTIHGVILWALFDDRGTTDVGPFNLASQLRARLELDPVLFWNAVLLAVFHLLSFVIYWLGRAAWRETGLLVQTYAPYGRIVVVHVAIMVAGLPVILLGQPLIAVVFLALVKTVMETSVARLTDLLGEGSLLPWFAERARDWTERPHR